MSISHPLVRTGAFVLALAAALFATWFVESRRHTAPPTPEVSRTAEPPSIIPHEVVQSTLDSTTNHTYTTLKLSQANDDQTLPDRIWVQSLYFTPEQPGKFWSSEVTEVDVPFALGGEVLVESACPMCDFTTEAKPTYYTRVRVSGVPFSEDANWNQQEDLDIATATPVLIQDGN